MGRAAGFLFVCVLAAGCDDDNLSPTPSNAAAYGAAISPGQEVMPVGVVNNSTASGIAFFSLHADGVSLDYLLDVDDIRNVVQAHIHQAPIGSNGPVVAWLFPSTAPVAGPTGAGQFDGVLAAGTITAANLVGPLAGQPLSALAAAIRAGNTYVNIHTDDGVAPTNTGPGDYPGGEMRGQID